MTRKLIELYLAPLGYRVHLGSDAQELEDGGHADCVVMVLSLDYLAHHDGEVMKRLGRLHPGVPVLGVASSEQALEQEFVVTHFPRVLFKPLKSDELILALENTPLPSWSTPEVVQEAPASAAGVAGQPATSMAMAAVAPESGDVAAAGVEDDAMLAGLDAMHAEMGLDAELVAELVGSFLQRGQGYMEELDSAVAQGDAAEVDRIAHAMKGMAGNLRFNELTGACEALRGAAQREELDACPELITHVGEAFERVSRAIRQRWPDL